MTEVKQKLTVVEGTGGEASVPKTSNKINAVSMQGVYYYLETNLNEDFMEDFHNLPSEDIVNKYALVEVEVVDAKRDAQTPQRKQNS